MDSISIERLKYIADLSREDIQHSPIATSACKARLFMGKIQFKDVSMRYSFNSERVLKGLSFTIMPGQKVGICGRTGSGKSSLLAILFRLVDIEAGGTICVDDEDIYSMSRYDLRCGMSIIPQEPLLLEMSIRENLDIEGTKTDSEIWEALEKTGVKELIEQLPGKLDHQATTHGGSISRGSRQLLALARAYLRGRSILCLDEASSSVDEETDQTMQKALRANFADSTMLIVAHRISTIRDVDVVLVMEEGEIVEMGPPDELLLREGGKFRQLANGNV